jgi:hypothetical protein
MTLRLESRPMRRFVVLLLLVVMQLQQAWGAAAAYCDHESGAATGSHFGHHEHSHSLPDGSGNDLGGMASTHPDCQSCHFACVAVPPGPAQAYFAWTDVAPAAVPPPSFDSFIPDGPERPDRRVPAAA